MSLSEVLNVKDHSHNHTNVHSNDCAFLVDLFISLVWLFLVCLSNGVELVNDVEYLCHDIVHQSGGGTVMGLAVVDQSSLNLFNVALIHVVDHIGTVNDGVNEFSNFEAEEGIDNSEDSGCGFLVEAVI